MYYLGNKNEDVFVTTAIKLGYPMLTKKMDNITAATMWQESKISLTSQRIILRYLSNLFGSRLVVPEHCIDKLGQTYFCTKPISKIPKKSLERLYCQRYSDISQCKSISTMDIVLVVIMFNVKCDVSQSLYQETLVVTKSFLML